MKPIRYSGRKAREISFPLGGIGSGCIGLGGAGHLVDWEVFNRPAKGSRNGFSHFAVKAERDGEVLDARVLHGDVAPPYGGSGSAPFAGIGFGVARETLSGLPHFRSSVFTGGFPIAEVAFEDPAFPGTVTLSAFNPFIPHNDRDSSIPAAFFTVTVVNTSDGPLDFTVGFTVRNPGAFSTNRFTRPENAALLAMQSGLPATDPAYSDFAVATDADDASAQEYWYRGRWFDNLGVYWRDFCAPGRLVERTYADAAPADATPTDVTSNDHGTIAARLRAGPGESVSARFVLAWNVPNCSAYWKEPEGGAGGDGSACCGQDGGPACGSAPGPKTWRNYYATLFEDSAASATYALANWARLEEQTRLFRDTLFASTLPRQVIDAVSANISILKSPTCLRLEDGSFYGWEGCHGESGCCEGSCTHVWNYAYALPFLFPSLERSMRDLDYRYNLRSDGGMPFRLQLPLGSEQSRMRPCVDGQFGGVVKVYREWKLSGDTSWLKRLWPAVRSSIEFAWSPSNADRWDPDRTGVVHGRQHHTLDMELFGANSWLTGFYLAALKAGAEMAQACDDPVSAEAFGELFSRGQEWANRHLWNGEYFRQLVDLDDQAVLADYGSDPTIRDTYWSAEHGELKYQVGEGCGIDQVVAQWHADLAGLGDLFDREKVRGALAAIYRHNYRASMRDVVNPCRLYCLDDEAGTQMVSWPQRVRRPVVPVPYAEETMHGFEYQAASHMVINGMVDEGLALVAAVRDRYDGERRNPWNEIECGSNYARSMASYALLNAYSGLSFDATRGEIGFAPVAFVRGRFRCFWALGTGWGDVEVSPAGCRLRVLSGELAVKRVGLRMTGARDLEVKLGRRQLRCRVHEGAVVLEEAVTVGAGQALRIACEVDCGA